MLAAIVGKLDDIQIHEADSLASRAAAVEEQPLDVALIDLRAVDGRAQP